MFYGSHSNCARPQSAMGIHYGAFGENLAGQSVPVLVTCTDCAEFQLEATLLIA